MKHSGIALLSVLLAAGCVSTGEPSVEHRETVETGAVRLDLPALDEDPDIETYLQYAALNSAGLEAASARWHAALERIPQARGLPDPRLTYAYFIEQVETRVGPQQHKLSVAQTLPWFGTLGLRGDAASRTAEAARLEYEQTRLELFYSVKAAYYDYWYLSRALAITREHLELVSNLEGVARAGFKSGKVAHSSVVQAQLELGKLDDRFRSLEALRGPSAARLNAALNRDTGAELPWPTSIPDVVAAFPDESVIASLRRNSPELLRLESEASRAEIEARLAAKDSYPDLSLGVDYVETGDAIDPALPGSGKDAVMAMVSVSIPLWRGQYDAAKKEARLKHAAAVAQKADAGNRLEAESRVALYHLRDAERKINLYEGTLMPKAEEAVEVARQGFEAGAVEFITLVDAQRALLEFQLAAEKALAERGKRLAEVEMLVGRKIED